MIFAHIGPGTVEQKVDASVPVIKIDEPTRPIQLKEPKGAIAVGGFILPDTTYPLGPNRDGDIITDGSQARLVKVQNSIAPDEVGTKRSKYHREILPGVWVDVYDVIGAFNVKDGGFQHAIKKLLACGIRGHKSEAEDRKDIQDSIISSNNRYKLFNKSG